MLVPVREQVFVMSGKIHKVFFVAWRYVHFNQFVCLGLCCLSHNVVALLLLLLCVCLHSGEKEMDNRRGGTLSFTERFFKRCADVLAERESLHLRGRVRGRERMADSAVRDEVHSFKALIASGKRSHFPNHIHAPIIYFLPPAPVLLCLSHSLLQCWDCLSLFLMSAFVQSSPCLSRGESSVNVKPANCDLQGARRSRWVTRVAAWHEGTERGTNVVHWKRLKGVLGGNEKTRGKLVRGRKRGDPPGVWRLAVMFQPVQTVWVLSAFVSAETGSFSFLQCDGCQWQTTERFVEQGFDMHGGLFRKRDRIFIPAALFWLNFSHIWCFSNTVFLSEIFLWPRGFSSTNNCLNVIIRISSHKHNITIDSIGMNSTEMD